jgi:hypothetical protein
MWSLVSTLLNITYVIILIRRAIIPMKKNPLSLITATAIGILLLNSFFAMSTFSVKATSADGTQWQLSVTGLVNNPLNLAFSNITAMPQTAVEANIYCVDFPAQMVTGGRWTGVKLSYILEEAGVLPSAIKVAFYAADGYSTDLDLETATRENVILAYEKDGEPLSETLRLVVPGKWGYKWISQVTSIVLVNIDFKGKWESQGYSDAADMELSTNHPSQPEPTSPNSTSSQPVEPTTPPAITQPSNSSSSAPSQDTQNPKPEAISQTPEPIPATWIVSALAMVAVSMCLLVYVKKRRH